MSAREKLLGVSTRLLASLLCASALAETTARAASPRQPPKPTAPQGRTASPAAPSQPAQSQTQSQQTQSKPAAGAKVYRGSIGGRGVEVSLRREGERVTGSYNYDGAAERLRLEGRVGGDGKLALEEFDRAGRQTGKFACEPGGGDQIALDIDLECEWSKPAGEYKIYAGLTEQHVGFTRAWGVRPRQIVNRRYGVAFTYPQIVAARGAVLTPGAQAFNRRAAALAAKVAREFAAGPVERGMYLRANYVVLLATDDLVSVELEEENDYGGGRPNTKYYGLTCDLRGAGRELRLGDLFKTGADFERALLRQAYEAINRSYREINRREAASGAATPGDEDLMAGRADGVEAWALTTRGVVVYFNFPQVMAAFDRNFVPYAAVKDLLRADGPAAVAARAAR